MPHHAPPATSRILARPNLRNSRIEIQPMKFAPPTNLLVTRNGQLAPIETTRTPKMPPNQRRANPHLVDQRHGMPMLSPEPPPFTQTHFFLLQLETPIFCPHTRHS
jgi:hypothetical protein